MRILSDETAGSCFCTSGPGSGIFNDSQTCQSGTAGCLGRGRVILMILKYFTAAPPSSFPDYPCWLQCLGLEVDQGCLRRGVEVEIEKRRNLLSVRRSHYVA